MGRHGRSGDRVSGVRCGSRAGGLALALCSLIGCSAAEDEPAPDTTDTADTANTADTADTPDAADTADDVAPDTIDGAPDGGDAVVTGEAVCAGLAEAMCGALAPCGCGDGGAVAACEAAVEAECLRAGAAELAAVAARTMTVSASGLAACLEAHREAGRRCDTVVSDPLANARVCGTLFTDVAAVGEVCASGLGGASCAAGAGVCFPEPTGTTCRRFAEPGTPCAAAPCPAWRLCMPADEGGDGLVCGEPRDVGGRCEADVHCRAELRCDGGRCVAGLTAGEPCRRAFDCGAGLTCDPFEERCAVGTASGEACLTATQCASGLTCLGLSVGLVCVPGDAQAGSDEPGLPGLFEPCIDRCARGLECAEGPLAGECAPAVCGYLVAP